jgi:biotin operon repressor
MFFFFPDSPRPEMIKHLSRIVTSRSALNKHVRELQKTALGNDAEASSGSETPVEHDSWSDEELDAVLDRGLDALNDLQLTWLRKNPIALFELFDAINESLPSKWIDLILADAQRLRKSHTKDQHLEVPQEVAPSNPLDNIGRNTFGEDPVKILVTSRDALVKHVRNLQRKGQAVVTENWPEDELQQILEQGIDVLSKHREQWLRQNPIALFELFDAINENLPSCWMDLILADAQRLWKNRPSA